MKVDSAIQVEVAHDAVVSDGFPWWYQVTEQAAPVRVLTILEPNVEVNVRLVSESCGGFSATIEELAGVHGEGETEAEAVRSALEGLEIAIESYLASGDPIPWRAVDSALDRRHVVARAVHWPN